MVPTADARARADWGFYAAAGLVGAGAWTLLVDPDCLRVVPSWGWALLGSCTALDLVVPLVGALLPGRRVPPPPPVAGHSVAVIAPDLRARALHETLRSVRASELPDARVALYVDGDRGAAALAGLQAAADARTHVLLNTSWTRSAKAHGLEVLRSVLPPAVSIVEQLDGGTVLRRDAPSRALAPIVTDPRVGAVSGTLRVRTDLDAWLGRAQQAEFLLSIGLARPALSRLGLLWLVSGAFGAYRREALDGVGGWRFDPGEDALLALDLLVAGHRLVHVEEAVAYTDCPKTPVKFFNQRLRWTRTLVRCLPWYTWALLRAGRPGPAAGLLLEGAVAVGGPVVWLLGVGQLVVAGLAGSALALLAVGAVVHGLVAVGLLALANRRLVALGHAEDVVSPWTGLLLPLHAEVHRLSRLAGLGFEVACCLPFARAVLGRHLYDPFMPEHVVEHDVQARRMKLRAWFERIVSWVRRAA